MSGETKPCPNPLAFCTYEQPFADSHHLYWPKDEYSAPIEKQFRSLEVNIVRGMCRCLHNLQHLKKPPSKPSVKQMKDTIRENQ